MDIRVLQYFLTVAREESITKAAEQLHMTQPPLSRQLKDLEEELGKQLLIRGSKRITLTEDGMLLRKRAEEMVSLMEKTKAELASSSENINGEIYIGCGETEAISFFAQAAQKKGDRVCHRSGWDYQHCRRKRSLFPSAFPHNGSSFVHCMEKISGAFKGL